MKASSELQAIAVLWSLITSIVAAVAYNSCVPRRFGAWHLAEKYPGRFAALVVICGGIRPPAAARKAYPDLATLTPADLPKSYSEAAERVGKTPVWIFHGADDDIVPVTESRRMSEAMKRIGAEVLYTEYPGGTHASWERAYDEPKLFLWLFSKSLGVPSRPGSARPRRL